MLKGLLLKRLALFNISMAVFFGWLTAKGYVLAAVAADPTFISLAIAVLWVVMLASTVRSARKTSQALNTFKDGKDPDQVRARKRLTKIEHIKEGAEWMAVLGLIGTVVGLLISFSGIDGGAISGAQALQEMMPRFLSGMGVALYTTLAGAFFSLWTSINYRMLHTATACLVEDEKNA